MKKTSNTYGKDFSIGFEKLDSSNRNLLELFCCDNPYIDNYFRNKAYNDKHATTYLFINEENAEKITIVTINCSGIVDTSSSIYRDMIPAIEISYFATNDKYQKISYSEDKSDKTLSHQLLLYCIDYILRVPYSHCAASKLILYSVPDAVNFYTHAGFQSFLEFMEERSIPALQGCVPMFLNLA